MEGDEREGAVVLSVGTFLVQWGPRSMWFQGKSPRIGLRSKHARTAARGPAGTLQEGPYWCSEGAKC